MSRKSRYNHYHIQILFECGKKQPILGNSSINYLNNNRNLDTLIIFTDEIYLISSRSKIYSGEDILHNSTNSISKQILKALVYYYSHANNKIKEVIITRKTAKIVEVISHKESTEIKQPLEQFIYPTRILISSKIEIILQETEKGNAILNSLSYYLRGISSTEKFYKFERFWRSLNSIFRFHSNSDSDFEGIRKLRELIIQNQDLFPETINLINQYSLDSLRNTFRWRGLILNDFPTSSHTKSFSEFVKRYSDKRIMELLLMTLPYRKDFLVSQGYYTDVLSHINNNISNNTRNDGELVALIALKYTYFVRNKIFHGEIPESAFKFVDTKEEDEIKNLNQILESLNKELINNNDVL